jgi:hypothetical protein
MRKTRAGCVDLMSFAAFFHVINLNAWGIDRGTLMGYHNRIEMELRKSVLLI